MNFKDVISEKLLNGFGGADLTVAEIALTLGITFIIALYLFVVYRVITENAFYSKNFNISLVAMALVTAGIIMAMQSSLVISLGMVGALSIVRFRTAIKEPLDLMFLFWSIGSGIICGAGLYKVAIVLAVCVTCAIVLLKLIPEGKSGQMLFVSHSADVKREQVEKAVADFGKVLGVKSTNVTSTGVNSVYEVKVNNPEGMVNALKALNGMNSVSLMAHDGEFRG